MRRYCPSDRHGGSRFRGFALAFTSLARELAREITSFLTVDCFSNGLFQLIGIHPHGGVI